MEFVLCSEIIHLCGIVRGFTVLDRSLQDGQEFSIVSLSYWVTYQAHRKHRVWLHYTNVAMQADRQA